MEGLAACVGAAELEEEADGEPEGAALSDAKEETELEAEGDAVADGDALAEELADPA